MKRAPGGGRKGVAGPARSRTTEFKCPVCDYIGRSDNVTQHLRNSGEFDSRGKPLKQNSESFKQLSVSKKKHTLYFENKNLEKTSVINLKVEPVAVNPFAAAAHAAEVKKRKFEASTEVGDIDQDTELEDSLPDVSSNQSGSNKSSVDEPDVSRGAQCIFISLVLVIFCYFLHIAHTLMK